MHLGRLYAHLLKCFVYLKVCVFRMKMLLGRVCIPVQVCNVTEMCIWVVKEQTWLWRQTVES